MFVGKLAYLALFPGVLFMVTAGAAARAVAAGAGGVIAGFSRPGRMPVTLALNHLGVECVASGGSTHAAVWLVPAVRLTALSWACCILFGFLPGDLFLLYSLLLLAAGSGVLFAFVSDNPRVRRQAWPEAVSLCAWALPFSLVTGCLVLRTGEVGVLELIRLQGASGSTLAGPSGGAAADVGMALALLAALFATSAFSRLKPLGRNGFLGAGALLDEVSGPPLAFFLAGDAAALFVSSLTLVACFFAGPAGNWYQVAFWALKVAGVLVLLGLVDAACSRARQGRVALWGVAMAGGIALAAAVLVWVGVRT